MGGEKGREREGMNKREGERANGRVRKGRKKGWREGGRKGEMHVRGSKREE